MYIRKFIFIVIAWLFLSSVMSIFFKALPTLVISQEKEEVFKNRNLTAEQQSGDLLSKMTLDEKITQLSMKSHSQLKFGEDRKVTEESLDNYLRQKTRLEIPAIQIAECLYIT